MSRIAQNYCSVCGEKTVCCVPAGDNRERAVCEHCGTVHYSNPNNVCGAILTWQGKILLCKRAIEPRHGLWTLPAGFMENGETLAEAAARESMEEANARARELKLFGVFSLPHISQVYVMFKGELATPEVSPGIESLETALVEPEDIPWDELAFPVVRQSLKLYLQDPVGDRVHNATAIRHEDGRIEWFSN